MKKNIYKVRLKKILVSMLLIIMLFQVIMPSMVFAAKEETMTYNEWLEYKSGSKNFIIRDTENHINDNIYMNIVDKNKQKERTEKLLTDRGDKIRITGYVQGGMSTSFKISKLEDTELSLEELQKYGEENESTNSNIHTYTYDEFINFAGEEGREKLIEVIQRLYFDDYYAGVPEVQKKEWAETALNQNKSVAKITVEGTKDNYTITSVDMELTKDEITKGAIEEEKEDSADLGGILLSPIFYLINFIADAIVCVLQNTMNPAESTGWTVLKYEKIEGDASAKVILADDANTLGKIKWPHITYTPEEIFSGEIDLLSIDFITGDDGNKNVGWKAIRTVVAQWYNVLRMVAIIGLLSVLIYTGIKILISVNAKDKAKYKEWIINWIVAVGILFFMHYIMALIVYATGEFSQLLSEAGGKINVVYKDDKSVTNLMGAVRFMIQSENFYAKVGYEVMYIALIVYTIKFTFIYLKRVLNMAFLTLIAPIVALTYPIDKINDGRAQGFDMWLKEYIFNALLQPMHQIMYYILMGSAISIAAENPLYGIVVLAFLTEAERLLKKIFGFDKAGGGTVGGVGNAFAAGAIASNIAKMAKLPKGNASRGSSGGSEDGSSNYMDMLKPEKDSPVSENFENLLDDGAPESGFRGGGTSDETGDDEEPDDDNRQGDQGSRDQEKPPQNYYNSEKLPSPQKEEKAGDEPDNSEPDEGASGKEKSAFKRGIDNVRYKAGRKLGLTKDMEYNKHVWKRVGGRALKKGLRMTAGAALGLTATAVQAGISITDGKYNPMEGLGAFTAGYAGGGRVTDQVGGTFGSLANTFNEGYYSGKEGKEKLLEKRKQQFMFDDKVDQAYRQKYQDNPDKAKKMKELARDQLVPFGVTDPKDQFAVQKFAEEIVKKKGENLNAEQKDALLGQAIEQGRKTQGFIDNLTAQGQQKAINDPAQQQKYIEAQLKAAGVTAESERGQSISRNLNNAFKSAAVYQQVNRKR